MIKFFSKSVKEIQRLKATNAILIKNDPNGKILRSRLNPEQINFVDLLYELIYKNKSADYIQDFQTFYLMKKRESDSFEYLYSNYFNLEENDLKNENIWERNFDNYEKFENSTLVSSLLRSNQQTSKAVITEIKEETKVEKETIDLNKRFTLQITEIDQSKKLNIIKEVKTLTGLGLKDSKDLIEKLPSIVKKDLSLKESQDLKLKLETIGCQIKLI